MPSTFDSAVYSAFVFRQRPESIPADMRPIWRIGLLLLMLSVSSRGARSSFGRLQLLNWSLLHDEGRDALLSVLDGARQPNAIMVRIEPSLNRAVDFATAEGLVRTVGGSRIELTEVGEAEAARILAESSLYVKEREYLSLLGKRVTETLVSQIFSGVS